MSDLGRLLGETLRAEGACLAGFADLTGLPPEVRRGLPRAVSLAVPLAPGIVAGLAGGPTPEYFAEYRRVNTLLGRLAGRTAELLSERGFAAVALEPTSEDYDRATLASPLPHKTAATRAGLGWIGKCALLVTERCGSALRLSTVLTDAPLPAGIPVDDSRCGDCLACVTACPTRAPSGGEWRIGLPRADFFDAFACERNAKAACRARGFEATICGVCIAVCPWTRRYLRRAGEARS